MMILLCLFFVLLATSCDQKNSHTATKLIEIEEYSSMASDETTSINVEYLLGDATVYEFTIGYDIKIQELMAALLEMEVQYDPDRRENLDDDGYHRIITVKQDKKEYRIDLIKAFDYWCKSEKVCRILDKCLEDQGEQINFPESMPQPLPEEMPENFTFSINFGAFGNASYDSKTGKLVKTTDATNPELYEGTYLMSKEELSSIYSLIREVGLENYPAVLGGSYFAGSDPYETYSITLRAGDFVKTITAKQVEFAYLEDIPGLTPAARRYAAMMMEIIDILVDTEEWKAFPDYEYTYD